MPRYVAATPERRYRKNPLTYLNGKCWQDEETPDLTTARPAPFGPPPAPKQSKSSPTAPKQSWS